METKDAIDHLANALLIDEGYYNAWKANIAMAFQDEFMKECRHKGIAEISNSAASRFLTLLIQTSNNSKELEYKTPSDTERGED